MLKEGNLVRFVIKLKVRPNPYALGYGKIDFSNATYLNDDIFDTRLGWVKSMSPFSVLKIDYIDTSLYGAEIINYYHVRSYLDERILDIVSFETLKEYQNFHKNFDIYKNQFVTEWELNCFDKQWLKTLEDNKIKGLTHPDKHVRQFFQRSL